MDEKNRSFAACGAEVTRQIVAWLKPTRWEIFTIGNFPCWFMNDDDGNLFYGFPILPPKHFSGPVGLKLAHHKRGEPADSDNVDRSFKPGEAQILIDTEQVFSRCR